MRQRECRYHDYYKESCGDCIIKSWRTEILSGLGLIAVTIIHFCYLQMQISDACGWLGSRDVACLAREQMPSYWTLANPAYIYIWDINYLKTGSVDSMGAFVSSGVVDFGIFVLILVGIILASSYLFAKYRNHMKLDAVRMEFKEKELRMKLSAEFDDKAKAVESRHKQLTAPSADPSIWSDEKVYDGELV